MPSLHIDGAWTSGSGGTAEVINPYDASVVEVVDQAGRDDVERAVSAARAAFDSGPWRTTPLARSSAPIYATATAAPSIRSEDGHERPCT